MGGCNGGKVWVGLGGDDSGGGRGGVGCIS